MPLVEVGAQRIYYEDTGGAGRPLVLAHGFLLDSEMFAPQVAALAPAARVITWDQRGHGRTESTAEDFTYWDSADDLAGLLDALGIERAVVGGMSQGGFISLRFALRHRDRVTALVLLDSQAGLEVEERVPQYDMMVDVWASDGPNDALAEMVAAIVIGDGWPGTPAWIEKWRARPWGGVRQIYRTLMRRDDLTSRLGEITAPALVVHGDRDAAIDMDRAEALAAGLPGARGVVVIRGGGHAANLTHPGPVNEAISGFLASLPG